MTDCLKQLPAIVKRPVLRRPHQEMGPLAALGEEPVDVTLAVGNHGHHVSPVQHIGGGVQPVQPALRFLVLQRPGLAVRHLASGAVHYLRTRKPDDAAMLGIHRDQRMQEQPDVRAIAHRAEALLAPHMGLEVDLAGILDGQHMPARRAQARGAGRRLDHLPHRHRVIMQEPPEAHLAPPVAAELAQAHRAQRRHRRHEIAANFPQPLVAERPKLHCRHALTSSQPNHWCRSTESRNRSHGQEKDVCIH